MTRSESPDLGAIRASVALVGRLSDGLFRLGPLNLGLEAVFSWIPGVGEIYSAGAAAFLLVQGVRARVPASTLVMAAAMMGGRTLITVIPVAGAVAADLLTAHRWSARLILAAIDRRIDAERREGAFDLRPGAWRERKVAAV